MFIVRRVYSIKEFEEYYNLRYNILRKPWNQILGSEKDDLEFFSFHYAAFFNNKIVGVVRFHFVNSEVQIRYMAVREDFRNKRIGFFLLKTVENEIKSFNVKKIFLNSRITAVKFYEKLGYEIVREVNPLFGIRHFRMEKIL